MSARERDVLLAHLLAPRVRTYVEWGSGGSTELVAWLALSGHLAPEFVAHSIESSPEWMRRMLARSSVLRRAQAKGKLHYHHGDLGPTGWLGYPLRFSPVREPERALPYVSLQSRGLGAEVDLALVDGRFRVACALEALKHLSQQRGRLLMHDYIPNATLRSKYPRVRRFYRLIGLNDTLATLRPTPPSADAAGSFAAFFAEALLDTT